MFRASCGTETKNQCIAKRVVCICDVVLKHPLFKNLVREQTHEFSAIADIVELRDKEVLFFKLQSVDKVYFVLDGAVKLCNQDSESSKEYIYQIAEKGDAIGLENLFSGLAYYPYSVSALADTKILSLKAQEFKEAINNDPVIKNNFLEYLSSLSLGLYDRSKDFVLTSVAERLLKYLEFQAKQRSSAEFKLELSKTDLANYLGTVSATLSRAFKELEESNKISVAGQNLKVLSLASSEFETQLVN